LTLTFIVDPGHEHQVALRRDAYLPDGLAVSEPVPVLGYAEPATSLRGRPWRIAAALFSKLRGSRRLPPQDDHLRRDIGLSELEMGPEYWHYHWYWRDR